MARPLITERERWLEDAIHATRAYVGVEEAENAYDLRAAAPGSSDYDRALHSQEHLLRAARTVRALEAELAGFRTSK